MKLVYIILLFLVIGITLAFTLFSYNQEKYNQNINNFSLKTNYYKDIVNLIKLNDNINNKLNNIPIYFINLKHDISRRKFIENQIQQYNINNCHFIDGLYGKDMKKVNGNIYKINDIQFYCNDLSILPSEIGCTLSTLKVFRTVVNKNNDFAIICDDDVDLFWTRTWDRDVWNIISNAPHDWDMIQLYSNLSFLTYEDFYIDTNKHNIYSTACYIINKKGCLKILENCYQNNMYILDKNVLNNYTSTKNKNLSADVYIPIQLNSYAVKYPHITTYNDFSNMNSTIHPDHTSGHIYRNIKNQEYLTKQCIKQYSQIETFQIPKILHLIWIGDKSPPKLMNTWLTDFPKKYPDWTVKVWGNDDVKFLQNKKEYDDISEICGKADILRYEIMYHYGGVYIDADTSFLNTLPESPGLLNFFREDNNLIANTYIACIPKHPFMKLIVDSLPKHYQQNKHLQAWQSVGPTYITNIYNKLANEQNDVIGISIIERRDVVCPDNWHGISSNNVDTLLTNCKKKKCFAFHYGISTNHL
jgi:mannosyltransferase OCH1-like enzyme